MHAGEINEKSGKSPCNTSAGTRSVSHAEKSVSVRTRPDRDALPFNIISEAI